MDITEQIKALEQRVTQLETAIAELLYLMPEHRANITGSREIGDNVFSKAFTIGAKEMRDVITGLITDPALKAKVMTAKVRPLPNRPQLCSPEYLADRESVFQSRDADRSIHPSG